MNLRVKTRIVALLYTISRLLLGVVFLYACWDKILNPAGFAEIIRNYQILPSPLVVPSALLLPWVELVCGISLIVHRWTQGAALVVTLLMLIFMAALGYNMYRGVDVSCGCFTLDGKGTASMWSYMIRDTLLLVLAIGVMVYRKTTAVEHSPALQTATHNRE
jgi:uncharacterized membrane protein YphA (DoxX/SURF4 family)